MSLELRDQVLESLLARRRDINREFHRGEKPRFADLKQIQLLIRYFTLEVPC